MNHKTVSHIVTVSCFFFAVKVLDANTGLDFLQDQTANFDYELVDGRITISPQKNNPNFKAQTLDVPYNGKHEIYENASGTAYIERDQIAKTTHVVDIRGNESDKPRVYALMMDNATQKVKWAVSCPEGENCFAMDSTACARLGNEAKKLTGLDTPQELGDFTNKCGTVFRSIAGAIKDSEGLAKYYTDKRTRDTYGPAFQGRQFNTAGSFMANLIAIQKLSNICYGNKASFEAKEISH